MQTPMLEKEDAIRFLGEIMDAEMEKPDDEIDLELLRECDAFLAELLSDVEISEEKMRENIAKIKGEHCYTKAPKARILPSPRFRRVIAAVVAAAILVGGGITAYAFVPAFRDMVRMVLGLDQGSQIQDGGVTYTYSGKAIKYDTLDELIQEENLRILYPHNLPEALKIKTIIGSGEGENLTYNFAFVDGITGIRINAGEIDLATLSKKTEKLVNSHNIVSYILIRENAIISTTVYNGWTYYITTNTLDNIKIILENLY